MKMYRKLKLSAIETRVLRKVRNRQVKNIEVPTGIVHPLTGEHLKASAVNLTNQESYAFGKLRNKGLIACPVGAVGYYTDFKITPKGHAQLKK